MNIFFSNASPEDAASIYEIVTFYAGKGVILGREISDIHSSLNNFIVAKIKNHVIGIVSYYDYGQTLKEIRSLAVIEKHQRKGIGSSLLKHAIDQILISSHAKIFTLTYAPEFFKKNGFFIVDKETLPEKIWKDCSKCKNRNQCGETALVYKEIKI